MFGGPRELLLSLPRRAPASLSVVTDALRTVRGVATDLPPPAVFAVADRVVLKDGIPGHLDHVDHVGTVTAVDADGDGVVWVQWVGPDAPDEPSKYRPGALELWDPRNSL